MKNSQKGNASIILIIVILLALGGGFYFYSKGNKEVKVEDVDTSTDIQSTSTIATTTDVKVVNKTLPDSEFLRDFIKDDPQAKVRARGDINGDGYSDAIVESVHCGGTSCSFDLTAIFNINNKSTEALMNSDFEPAYRGSSAVKSNVTNITIKDGIISLIGTALECPDSICDEAHRKIVRTVTYKFINGSIVQIGVNPPLETLKILKGVYKFNEDIGIGTEPFKYELTVKNEDAIGPITFTVDYGRLGLLILYAKGVKAGDHVDIVFDSYAEGSHVVDVQGNVIQNWYKKGDVLFNIKPSHDNGILLGWNRLQPDTEGTKSDTPTTFFKINN